MTNHLFSILSQFYSNVKRSGLHVTERPASRKSFVFARPQNQRQFLAASWCLHIKVYFRSLKLTPSIYGRISFYVCISTIMKSRRIFNETLSTVIFYHSSFFALTGYQFLFFFYRCYRIRTNSEARL